MICEIILNPTLNLISQGFINEPEVVPIKQLHCYPRSIGNALPQIKAS
jgi:hypothetical protein